MKKLLALFLGIWMLGCTCAQASTAIESGSEAPVSDIVLTFGGDTVLGVRENWWRREDALPAFLKAHGMDYPFQHLKSIFAADDMTMVNLECVLKSNKAGEQKDKQYRFRGLPEYTQVLRKASIEQVNVANNHFIDYVAVGRKATLEALKEAEIAHSGYGDTYVWEYHGRKIGFLGWRETTWKHKGKEMAEEVQSLRDQGCQVVILSAHWGKEYAKKHNKTQQKMADDAIKAGVDLIIGTHPHVVQGVTQQENTVILWSLGNLMFGGTLKMKTFDGTLAQVTLHFDENRYTGCTVNMIPVLTSSSAAQGVNDYAPTLAEGADKERIFDQIQQDSTVNVREEMHFSRNTKVQDPA